MSDSGLGPSELARLAKVNYQDIQHLLKKDIKRPRYLPELAKAMGTTVEDLLARKMPPPLGKQQAKGSTDEPQRAQIQPGTSSLSRDRFLHLCATLTDDQVQLLARLMAALGWVPGVKVEVIPTWDLKEEGSGRAEVKPMTPEVSEGEQARRGRL